MRLSRRIRLAAPLALVLVAVWATAALAASPRQTQYSNPTPSNPTSGLKGKTTPLPPTTVEHTGSLPFTGLELGLVVLVGAGLVAVGLGTRRLGRQS